MISPISRRNFLKISTAAVASMAVAPSVFASKSAAHERVLQFHNLHTGEHLKATFWAQDDYVAEELEAINRLLRDHRTGDIAEMDHRLLDQLYALQDKVGGQGKFEIISGYRSPKTNAMLQGSSSGVAKKSLHMQGRAADIRLPGVELKHLRLAALDLKDGGVGYYPKSNFIHVDTGRPRFW